MRPILLPWFTLYLFHFITLSAHAQCIADVYYLKDSPVPCNFVGTVDFDKTECFDFTASPAWKYTWKIFDADDGGLVAKYPGISFNHIFSKFGGYQFCLEIEQDPTSPGAEHIECVTYTTCELCGDASIEFEYIDCPTGNGCNLSFRTEIEAQNMVGLKPTTKYVFRYIPTEQEAMAGAQPFDAHEVLVDVSILPGLDVIDFSEDINVSSSRGCYEARIEFELEEEYAPHYIKDGPLCNQFSLFDDQVFQCIACNDASNGCLASKSATQVSNDSGTCKSYACPPFHITEFDAGYIETQKLETFFYPNPATDLVRFSLPDPSHDDMTLQLIDARGLLLRKVPFPAVQSSGLDVSEIPPGIYLLVLWNGDSVDRSEKLIIK